jgi:hypothetical protein
MLPSALMLAVLALGAHADLPDSNRRQGGGARAAAADVVWRYDTGG